MKGSRRMGGQVDFSNEPNFGRWTEPLIESLLFSFRKVSLYALHLKQEGKEKDWETTRDSFLYSGEEEISLKFLLIFCSICFCVVFTQLCSLLTPKHQ